MKHAEELNKLIAIAARRPDFNNEGQRAFEAENKTNLLSNLQTANLFFTCSVLGMEAVSHVIEDQAMNLGGQFRFYSAFQKFSRFRPQQERYQRLLTLGNPIYIFGIPDIMPPSHPNLKVVNLEKSPGEVGSDLSHSWVVILDNPQFVSMALVARELPGSPRPRGAPDKLVYRNFEGFWTYDHSVISQVVKVLDDYIEQHATSLV